ncbi:MAG: hypothetical protein WBE26_03820 [Phycisphaerae bacterium]
MNSNVNKIYNPRFLEGKAGPRRWTWTATAKGARWQRGIRDQVADTGGMTIISNRVEGAAFWSQVVVCKPGEFYRIEATVTCDLTVANEATADDAVGFVMAVQPMSDDRPVGTRRTTPGLRRASEPIVVRAFYLVPEEGRQLKLCLGVVNARGTACIHHVAFMEILEPEEMSHILAIPTPPYALPAPRVAKSVCVCSAMSSDRPITRLLAGCFGESNVHTVLPTELRPRELQADALLLPDAEPPPSIRSLAGLTKLAAGRIVVISLPAFAKLAGGMLSLCRVEQEDDPIHAKIAYANHATRGFALHDTFPYAWAGRTAGSFVQNHFRKTGVLKAFCDKHGFVTLLVSMCNQDVTTDRPICLYKETPGGGIFVLDIEPAEARGSTFGDPALAMYLLLSVLGRTQNSLGQYTAPVREEAELRESIREMGTWFKHVIVHAADLPIEEVTEQLVTIGREDQSYGLPLKPKPVILIRSGLTSGDMESVYGALVWFKQFVRMEPYACPYTHQLASQYRLAWIPCVAPWETRDGWRRSGRSSAEAMAVDVEGTELAALIDVASCPVNQMRVVLPKDDETCQRHAIWLPLLWSSFAPGRYFAPAVGDGEAFHDRDRFAWRQVRYDVHVVANAEAFQSDTHRDVIAAGGQVIRIEIPGNDADFTAHSIQRTDLAATVLEHVIGLQYGLIAVNRHPASVHFDAFPPLAPGEALILDRRDPMLWASAAQVG